MLSFEKYTFILAMINLLVLYIILRKLLFKKVTAFMDERTKKIKDNIDNAENFKKESAQLKAEYESRLNEALKESISIINEAKAQATKEQDYIINEAHKSAEKIMQNARTEIEQEKQQMLAEVKNYITELTIKTASKLISANMDTAKNKQLVAQFIEEEEGDI